MTTIAVYNMKGGVGKTTTAVNLSYLAASAGARTLLWDLDPQAAASFAFRVRTRVRGFGRKGFENGDVLGAAIRETDYRGLDVLPADFAYRKFDRLLWRLGRPRQVVVGLLDGLGRDYDRVVLDCPAGFSLLTEGILAAADAVLVPMIPGILSVRTVARIIDRADQRGSSARLAAFFNLVDRRRALHRIACQWSAAHPEIFLAAHVPCASVVERMAVYRAPLGAFAGREPAAAAFEAVWHELEARLEQPAAAHGDTRRQWAQLRARVRSLSAQLESVDLPEAPRVVGPEPRAERSTVEGEAGDGHVDFVHAFDTDGRDLQRCGLVLELRERADALLVVAARAGRHAAADAAGTARARIDRSWAVQILSEELSPLDALERRLGRPRPTVVDAIRATMAGRSLRRIDSRNAGDASAGRASSTIHLVVAPASRPEALAG
jgi:chromosome partitioning protein